MYSDARAIEQAMKALARKDGIWPSQVQVHHRLEMLYRDRLLSRVFSGGEPSPWILKGGSSILARTLEGRRTHDADIQITASTIDTASRDLQQLVHQDLGDHIRFEIKKEKEIIGQEGAVTAGRSLTFTTLIGNKRVNDSQIDLVITPPPTGRIESVDPIGLPRLGPLRSYPYRLYPVVDQIADKICAMHSTFGAHESSREKDLVDLVVLTRTQHFTAEELRVAIATAFYRRGEELPTHITAPSSWGNKFSKLAKLTPLCRDVTDINDALAEVRACLEPALTQETRGAVWSSTSGWKQLAANTDLTANTDSASSTHGEIWVEEHMRNGKLIDGHWRRRATRSN